MLHVEGGGEAVAVVLALAPGRPGRPVWNPPGSRQQHRAAAAGPVGPVALRPGPAADEPWRQVRGVDHRGRQRPGFLGVLLQGRTGATAAGDCGGGAFQPARRVGLPLPVPSQFRVRAVWAGERQRSRLRPCGPGGRAVQAGPEHLHLNGRGLLRCHRQARRAAGRGQGFAEGEADGVPARRHLGRVHLRADPCGLRQPVLPEGPLHRRARPRLPMAPQKADAHLQSDVEEVSRRDRFRGDFAVRRYLGAAPGGPVDADVRAALVPDALPDDGLAPLVAHPAVSAAVGGVAAPEQRRPALEGGAQQASRQLRRQLLVADGLV
mmetsp:Transcript_26077/g.82494  ORF Transcript_26077/g.82494 Transcript_26077/m.82494 type:complete len:322 (-) Transcript_26077:202-1167(-)